MFEKQIDLLVSWTERDLGVYRFFEELVTRDTFLYTLLEGHKATVGLGELYVAITGTELLRQKGTWLSTFRYVDYDGETLVRRFTCPDYPKLNVNVQGPWDKEKETCEAVPAERPLYFSCPVK
jgi:predicted AAA+ superfamily ATPase